MWGKFEGWRKGWVWYLFGGTLNVGCKWDLAARSLECLGTLLEIMNDTEIRGSRNGMTGDRRKLIRFERWGRKEGWARSRARVEWWRRREDISVPPFACLTLLFTTDCAMLHDLQLFSCRIECFLVCAAENRS